MPKVLRCRDVGMNCNEVIRAGTEDEVLRLAEEHTKRAHNVEMTPQQVANARRLIKDEPAQARR